MGYTYRTLLPIAVDQGFLGRRAALAARLPFGSIALK
jgi:hypothetical protein